MDNLESRTEEGFFEKARKYGNKILLATALTVTFGVGSYQLSQRPTYIHESQDGNVPVVQEKTEIPDVEKKPVLVDVPEQPKEPENKPMPLAHDPYEEFPTLVQDYSIDSTVVLGGRAKPIYPVAPILDDEIADISGINSVTVGGPFVQAPKDQIKVNPLERARISDFFEPDYTQLGFGGIKPSYPDILEIDDEDGLLSDGLQVGVRNILGEEDAITGGDIPETYSRGSFYDLDGDGKIGINDALTVAQAAKGIKVTTPVWKMDADGDGKVTPRDSALYANAAALQADKNKK